MKERTSVPDSLSECHIALLQIFFSVPRKISINITPEVLSKVKEVPGTVPDDNFETTGELYRIAGYFQPRYLHGGTYNDKGHSVEARSFVDEPFRRTEEIQTTFYGRIERALRMFTPD